MFIVKKKIHDKDYFYLRSSVRKDGKVKAKTIAYLGKNQKKAEKKAKEIMENMKNLKTQKNKKHMEDNKKENIQQEKPQKQNKEKNKKHMEDNKKEKEKNKEVEERPESEIIKKQKLNIDELTNFCKRKGFVFRSSDIYGGLAGFWDFGPLGIELFNNIKKEWWNYFVNQREDLVGIEASIISHPKTWKASGHVESFSDIAVKCKKCKKSTKIDKSELGKVKCDCGGDYESQGEFNLLFKTSIGALNPLIAYLRGETAQAMFMDFKLIAETSRMRLPFGIAQIGRCFRNEISPRDFLFRSREFHIGEFEYFIHPEEKKCELLTNKHLNLKLNLLNEEMQLKERAGNQGKLKETTIKQMLKQKKLGEWHAYWLAEQIMWFDSLGLKEIKIREHTKDELSHYSSATFDIDYGYPFGSQEVAGNANRGQYDLNQHIKESGKKLKIFDEKTGRNIIPRVIEPTFGMERVFLAALVKAYEYDENRENVVLKFPNKLAPYKAAVLPIVKNKKQFVKLAREIHNSLKKDFHVYYDESSSIGRRYARQDEIGTPYCITIDGDSIKNKDVTIRNRDNTQQIRVKIKDLKKIMSKLINYEINFNKAGKKIKTRKK